MDFKKEYERMMEKQTAMAIATAVDGVPNVRIVNFYYDEELKTLYFSTFGNNQKVVELGENPHVAFTTIPENGEEHVRVKAGVVKKSSVSVETIKAKFLSKMPEYIMSIPDVLPALILFEITFDEADVVIDFEHMETIAV
ncbi:pyridoxamine 5'-phosphate oxidase family protein [Anaerotignum propionicum]|uniref:Pyridoxamine 5'-phosphate oxidase n=1 Tax=Anaerotignum propionicum DSM 1682 TaxID=991789 RepID=A0A0X1U991_ANAPI|nr:pyridoxamine 5'-phosphate oxidase family protein [Anaerotignum propionicum]AMJ41517.1 pyridoxamine 5'-phosphate oxidase [Anaerotignum propionicum DSM 1682]SHE70381.1 Pyridoxamine 5'-phosphate oxidase [[Clostridium] propionicum DSM 1682] [Anaerotignum propionicum DSM 1682]